MSKDVQMVTHHIEMPGDSLIGSSSLNKRKINLVLKWFNRNKKLKEEVELLREREGYWKQCYVKEVLRGVNKRK